MGRGGRTQGRRAALHEHEPRAAAGDDAGVRYVQEEPKLKPVARRTLAHLSRPLAPFSVVRQTPISPGTAGVVTSSPFFSSSSPSPTAYNTCKWKLLKKKNPPSPASPAVAVGEKHIPLVRPPKPFRAADGRAMMGSVGPLELIARGGFSPE